MSRLSSASHSAGRSPVAAAKITIGPVARGQISDDRVELGPRLERALLPAPRRRVIHAELRRVDVDHPPNDGGSAGPAATSPITPFCPNHRVIVMSYVPPSADQPADGLARLERAGGVYVAEPGMI